MVRQEETDANRKMTDKSDLGSKLERSYLKVRVFILRNILYAKFGMLKMDLGTFLGRKSMRAKFMLEVEK